MSYKLFTRDLNDFYKDVQNKGTHYEVAQATVRDIWIKQGRYDELIDFILENWDSGNCDDFIEPLEEKLISESHSNRFKRLWRRVIYFRLTRLNDTLKEHKTRFRHFDLITIDKIDVSDFNMFSVDSYKDVNRVLAFRREFLLNGIKKYRKGLLRLNGEIEFAALDELEAGVRILDETKLKSKNWR